MEKTGKETSAVVEKTVGSETEEGISSVSISMDSTETQGFDVKARRRLLRKIDIHILPVMCLICLLVRSILIVSTRETPVFWLTYLYQTLLS